MDESKKEWAFPITDNSQLGKYGFTKHELGAFMIAQGLVGKYNMKEPEDQVIIAQMSYELADEILKQFKK